MRGLHAIDFPRGRCYDNYEGHTIQFVLSSLDVCAIYIIAFRFIVETCPVRSAEVIASTIVYSYQVWYIEWFSTGK